MVVPQYEDRLEATEELAWAVITKQSKKHTAGQVRLYMCNLPGLIFFKMNCDYSFSLSKYMLVDENYSSSATRKKLKFSSKMLIFMHSFNTMGLWKYSTDW